MGTTVIIPSGNAEQEQVDMGSSYEEEYGVYTEYEGSVESSETEEEYYSE